MKNNKFRKLKMLVSISGSRDYHNYETIKAILNNYTITKVQVGDAKGVDSLAIRYCNEKGIPYEVFEAKWKKIDNNGNEYIDRRAGLDRNIDIIRGTQMLIAFPSRQSKGTFHAMTTANKQFGILVHYYYID